METKIKQRLNQSYSAPPSILFPALSLKLTHKRSDEHQCFGTVWQSTQHTEFGDFCNLECRIMSTPMFMAWLNLWKIVDYLSLWRDEVANSIVEEERVKKERNS